MEYYEIMMKGFNTQFNIAKESYGTGIIDKEDYNNILIKINNNISLMLKDMMNEKVKKEL